MRTTLVLDDELIRRARHRAVDEQITLSDLVNRALRQALAPKGAEPSEPFDMVTYGSEDQRVHHEPANFAKLLEEEDRETLGEASP